MEYSVKENVHFRTEDALTDSKSAGMVYHAVSGRCAGFWYSAVCSMFAVVLLFCCFSCMDLDDLKLDGKVSSYPITYNLNSGNWARIVYSAPGIYKTDQEVMLPSSSDIMRTGYTFCGWYDNEMLSGSAISGWKAGEKHAAITLWAKWVSSEKNFSSFMFSAAANRMLAADVQGIINENSHTITVSVPNGTDVSALKATFKTDGTSSVTVGGVPQTSSVTANDFTKPVVYTITVQNGSKQEYTVIVTIRGSGEYSIFYNMDDGSWTANYTEPVTFTGADTVTLPTVKNIKRLGYTFGGWYDNEFLIGVPVLGWNARERNADVTLWAKWTATNYTVTFDNQSAVTAGTKKVTATYDAELPAIKVPTKTGYTFGGYWTETNGNGTQVYLADGTGAELWQIPCSTILYAKWIEGLGMSVSEAADRIASLPVNESFHTVVLSGAVGVSDVNAIKTALQTAGGKGVKIALDMSMCTGEESILFCMFRDCKNLTSVKLPGCVTHIEDRAFSGCESLISVVIPDNVKSIGVSAFYDCKNLISVEIPGSVTSIGDSAFRSCSSLTSVTIPKSVTSIANSAFWFCSSLTSVTIPESVTSIGCFVFQGCRALTSLKFKDPNGWMLTKSYSDWIDKTNGMSVVLSDTSKNVQYFTSTYYDFYFYKE